MALLIAYTHKPTYRGMSEIRRCCGHCLSSSRDARNSTTEDGRRLVRCVVRRICARACICIAIRFVAWSSHVLMWLTTKAKPPPFVLFLQRSCRLRYRVFRLLNHCICVCGAAWKWCWRLWVLNATRREHSLAKSVGIFHEDLHVTQTNNHNHNHNHQR